MASVDQVVAQAEAAMKRRGASSDKPIKIVYDPNLKGLAMMKGDGTLVIAGTGPGDWSSVDALVPWIYHEVAHHYTADTSQGGHNEEWASNFLPSAQEDLDEKALGVVLNHVTKKYPDLDVDAAMGASGRHSAGGSMMTREEQLNQAMRDALAEGGFKDAEIEEWMQKPWTAPPEAHEIMNAVVVDSGGQQVSQTPERLMVDDALIAAKIERGEELTPAEQARINGSTSSAQQDFMAALNADVIEYDWSWVYGGDMQLVPKSLDSNDAMIELYDHMVEVGALKDEGETVPDATKLTQVQEILTNNGGNALVQAAVASWGMETNNYIPTRTTDGVKDSDILALMQQGYSHTKAVTLGRIAAQNDLTPQELAEIWGGAEQYDNLIRNSVGQTAVSVIKGMLSGDGPRIVTPMDVAAKAFKEGLELFDGSRVLATIHVSDPNLAEKLQNDPWSLDTGELDRVVEMLGGEEKAGEKSADPQVNWLLTRKAGGFQAVATVDETAVEEAVRTLANTWNMVGFEGIAESTARRMLSDAMAVERARMPNPFRPVSDPVMGMEVTTDYVADAKQKMRGTREYQELFAHLGGGESEEEYVSRFDRRTQQLFGDDIVSVSRNAMRSGNINTSYQQGMLTDVGDSSTSWQEMIAKNAETFREML